MTTEQPRPSSGEAPRRDLVLFVLLIGTYAFFHGGGGPAQNSRYALTRSLVRSGRLHIDPYQGQTIDKARRGGHTYSDKAPGLSLAAVPGYAASLLLRDRPTREVVPEMHARLHVTTLLSVGLVSALGGLCLRRLLRGAGVPDRDALWATLVWSFGTPALAYSTTFMSHQFVAALLVASTLGLFTARREGGSAGGAALCGAAAGLAVISEYPAAVAGLLLFVYALGVSKPRRAALWFAAGAAPFLGVALAYNWACFGSPLATGYQFEASPYFRSEMARGFMGLTWPRPLAAWELLFGSYRGLLPLSPFLVLAVPGFFHMARERALRAEFRLCLAVAFFYIVFGSSYYLWDGGCSMGPRHLVPMLPFLAVPAALSLGRARRIGLALGVYSIGVCLLAVATFPEFPDLRRADPLRPGRLVPAYPRPLRDVVWPFVREGRASQKAVTDGGILGFVTPDLPEHAWDACNLGEVIGLPGLWSLAPLLALWGLGGWRLLRATAPSAAGDAPAGDAPAGRRYGAAVVLGIAALLLLWDLGRPLFWSDEAITAVYSRNTLRRGWPIAWDGRNLCAYEGGGSVSARDLGAWTYPLLQFYVTAASFAVLGESTWAARLPHALMGLAAVALVFAIARRFGLGRTTALFASIALAGSVQFLRFSRNCRYFSLTAFLAAAWVWLYLRLPERRWRDSWRPGWAGFFLGLASLLLFHAHFLVGALFGCAAAVSILAVDRNWRRLPILVPMGAAAAVAAAAYWVWVVKPAGVSAEAAGEASVWTDALTRLGWYIRDMNYVQVLPAGIAVLVAAVAAGRMTTPQETRAVLWLSATTLAYVLLLCVFSPQPVSPGTIDADVRYLAPLLPLTALLGAIGCAAVFRRERWLGGVLLIVWLATNLLSLNPSRSFLGEYVAATFRLRPVAPTSTEAAVGFLRRRADRDSLVLVAPPYRRDPLIYYLGDTLRFCGILPAEDARIVPRAREFGLPSYIYAAEVQPDFIVWFRMENRGLRPDIYRHVSKLPYRPPAVLRVWWDDLSRPELTRYDPDPPAVTDRNLGHGVWIAELDRRRSQPPAPRLDTSGGD